MAYGLKIILQVMAAFWVLLLVFWVDDKTGESAVYNWVFPPLTPEEEATAAAAALLAGNDGWF